MARYPIESIPRCLAQKDHQYGRPRCPGHLPKRSAQAKDLIEDALKNIGVTRGQDVAIDPLRMLLREIVELGKGLGLFEMDRRLGIVNTTPTGLISQQATRNGSKHILFNAHFFLSIQDGRITTLFDKPT